MFLCVFSTCTRIARKMLGSTTAMKLLHNLLDLKKFKINTLSFNVQSITESITVYTSRFLCNIDVYRSNKTTFFGLITHGYTLYKRVVQSAEHYVNTPNRVVPVLCYISEYKIRLSFRCCKNVMSIIVKVKINIFFFNILFPHWNIMLINYRADQIHRFLPVLADFCNYISDN